jgi:hypothetical protein
VILGWIPYYACMGMLIMKLVLGFGENWVMRYMEFGR